MFLTNKHTFENLCGPCEIIKSAKINSDHKIVIALIRNILDSPSKNITPEQKFTKISTKNFKTHQIDFHKNFDSSNNNYIYNTNNKIKNLHELNNTVDTLTNNILEAAYKTFGKITVYIPPQATKQQQQRNRT